MVHYDLKNVRPGCGRIEQEWSPTGLVNHALEPEGTEDQQGGAGLGPMATAVVAAGRPHSSGHRRDCVARALYEMMSRQHWTLRSGARPLVFLEVHLPTSLQIGPVTRDHRVTLDRAHWFQRS